MAFALGLIGAITYVYFWDQRDFSFNIFIVIWVTIFSDIFIGINWIKNESIYAILKALVAYVAFLSMGSILLKIELDGSIDLAKLIVGGMLPATIVFIDIKSKSWIASAKTDSPK